MSGFPLDLDNLENHKYGKIIEFFSPFALVGIPDCNDDCSCDHCGKGFHDDARMRRHVRRRHGFGGGAGRAARGRRRSGSPRRASPRQRRGGRSGSPRGGSDSPRRGSASPRGDGATGGGDARSSASASPRAEAPSAANNASSKVRVWHLIVLSQKGASLSFLLSDFTVAIEIKDLCKDETKVQIHPSVR